MRHGGWFSLLILAVSFAAYGQFPPCVHPSPPIPSFVIPYTGATSGCSNSAGANPNCVGGEVIQFAIGDGVMATDCYVEYVWDFGNGPVYGDASNTHVFSAPGVYPVKLTIADAAGIHLLSVNVPVINPWDIPVETTPALVLLAGILAAAGLSRLR